MVSFDQFTRDVRLRMLLVRGSSPPPTREPVRVLYPRYN